MSDCRDESNKRRRVSTDGTASTQSGMSPTDQSDDIPVPTKYLVGLQIPSELISLPSTHFLSPEEYEEARSCPGQCNLRLKTAPAEPSELASFRAVLPAADGCRLSPVIRAQVQRWATSAAEGRIELQLQVGVSQEILDRVVRGIYERKLLIDGSSFESLLLLAEYLQMDWLMKALQGFCRTYLISKPSLAICELAAAHTSLKIFASAVRTLMATAPAPEILVALVRMAPSNWRGDVLRAASQPDIAPEKRLDYLLSLSRHPDVSLTRQEAMHLTRLQPNLELLSSQDWFRGSNQAAINKKRAWAELYMQQKASTLTGEKSIAAHRSLVWDIPLEKAKANALRCPDFLTTTDGRSITIMTTKEGQEAMLWVVALDGCLKAGDRFKIFPVGSTADDHNLIEIKKDLDFHEGQGFPDLLSLFKTVGKNVIGNKLLPVVFQLV